VWQPLPVDIFLNGFTAGNSGNRLALSGNSRVGGITLNQGTDAGVFPRINLVSNFTGSIQRIDLRNSSVTQTIAHTQSIYNNMQIFTGSPAAHVTMLNAALGNFLVASTPPLTQAVSNTHQINASGVLVVR